MTSLDELLRRPAWQADGACHEHPDVNFFPAPGEDSRPAKAVCAGCLVRTECAAYATRERILCGIWGGTTGRDRRAARPALSSQLLDGKTPTRDSPLKGKVPQLWNHD
jgi:WhiB family redox-sensing transcriptional regulator